MQRKVCRTGSHDHSPFVQDSYSIAEKKNKSSIVLFDMVKNVLMILGNSAKRLDCTIILQNHSFPANAHQWEFSFPYNQLFSGKQTLTIILP